MCSGYGVAVGCRLAINLFTNCYQANQTKSGDPAMDGVARKCFYQLERLLVKFVKCDHIECVRFKPTTRSV